jgi:hypothetical protein
VERRGQGSGNCPEPGTKLWTLGVRGERQEGLTPSRQKRKNFGLKEEKNNKKSKTEKETRRREIREFLFKRAEQDRKGGEK